MPNFKSLDQAFSNTILINKTEYLYFAGTAYLGIPQHKEFLELYTKGILKYGLNNGTSRNNNIQLGIYNQAEEVAAMRFKAEDALITSSGYLAAQLTVKALQSRGKVIYAPGSHPAIWLAEPNSKYSSFSDWASATVLEINESEEKNWVLISNSMNNLFPEIFDFSFLKDVLPENKMTLIVDDSHGIGVLNKGLGAFCGLPQLPNVENVVVASLAKALGIDAGIVLSSNKTISELKRTNEFVGASPPSAAGLYAFVHAEEIYKNEWHKLQQNISFFIKNLDESWKYATNYPVYLTANTSIDQDLQNKNILISSFPYPNANSAPLNRIVLCSWHTEKNLNHLIQALYKA